MIKTIAAMILWAGLAASVLRADAPRKPAELESMMVNAIWAGAAAWNVNPRLMVEICRRESHLRWWAMGDHDAGKIPKSFGICAVKATTASAMLGRIVMGWELMNPGMSANVGARIFRACLDRHNNKRPLAVDCYRGVKNRLSADVRRRGKADRTRQIIWQWREAERAAAWRGELRLVRR